MNVADVVGFSAIWLCHCLSSLLHIYCSEIWKHAGELTGMGYRWPLFGSVITPCWHLYALIVIPLRQDMSEMYVKIFWVLFCPFFSLGGFREPHKVLWNQGKSAISQKPNTLNDGQWWVEAVKNHLPHLHIMIIRNTYLPFHFNDVPPLQEWPRFKEVVIFVSANFFFFSV